MNYQETHHTLKAAFDSNTEQELFGQFRLIPHCFESESYRILPGNSHYSCAIHGTSFTGNAPGDVIDDDTEDVNINDILIDENRKFNYHILKPKGVDKADKITFIFHGFNEKNWDKYLTWGHAIAERTKSTIIYFPLAFHMQRAPKLWSQNRPMFKLSEMRKKAFSNVIDSSLSNVAISIRLHTQPQRFVWSGLQTYYDIIQFIEEAKAGKNEHISPNFNFDIFAYSIGGFMTQIMKLSNYKGYFDKTKVLLFCSGPVFNRLSPVSKFILDSEANVALYSYLIEHFDSHLKKDPILNHYIQQDHIEGEVFHAMLDFKKMRKLREGLLKKYQNDFYAIALEQDTVIPAFEVINTLNGAYRDIDIPVDVLDFNYPYIHENPFPVTNKDAELINQSFHELFDKVGAFFNQ